MPNGRIGDNPLTDMFVHNLHPFPGDMEAMLWRLHAIGPDALAGLDLEPFEWEAGRGLDAGREQLRGMLRQHGIDPDNMW